MDRRSQVGVRRVWRRCRKMRGAVGPGAGQVAGESPALGPACIHLRRSPAAPPALSIRPPLRSRPFCSPRRPAVRRPWSCPRSRWANIYRAITPRRPSG